MWLDEALTAHIASLPIGQIPGALRHDGHPPLYYVLVHLWTQVFGTSDLAFRSLPGIFGVALLPMAWLVGRRVGGRGVAWCTVVLVAILPYALRYSTENRMYSLVMLLALVGYLLVDSRAAASPPAHPGRHHPGDLGTAVDALLGDVAGADRRGLRVGPVGS